MYVYTHTSRLARFTIILHVVLFDPILITYAHTRIRKQGNAENSHPDSLIFTIFLPFSSRSNQSLLSSPIHRRIHY